MKTVLGTAPFLILDGSRGKLERPPRKGRRVVAVLLSLVLRNRPLQKRLRNHRWELGLPPLLPVLH